MKIYKLHEWLTAAEDIMMIIKSDMHLFKLLMKMKKDLGQHNYNFINMFLHTRITEQTQKQTLKNILLTLYLFDLKFMKQKSLNELLKMNMWLKFQRHLILLCKTALHKWMFEKHHKFHISWKICWDCVILNAQCLILINSNTAVRFVCDNFEDADSKSIFILQDEVICESED